MKPHHVVIVVSLGLLLISTCVLACTDSDAARRTLESSGYKDIEITGFSMWKCGKDDDTATGFRATNPAGGRVEGTVCCGYAWKGCTIRF